MAKDLKTYLSNRRTRLPKRIAVEAAAQQMEQIHEARGGATFSLYFGDMFGQELFAVSLFPEPESALTFSGRQIPLALLRTFITVNLPLLSDPRLCVGTWYQEEDDMTFVDIVAVLPDWETAIALGKQYNQIAIFDLAAGEPIDTGGTGKWITKNIPPEQRLQRLKRG